MRLIHQKQRIASTDAAAWWCVNSQNIIYTETDCKKYLLDSTSLDRKGTPDMFRWADPIILKPKTVIIQSDVIVSGDSSAVYYPAFKKVSCDLHSQFSDYLTKYDMVSHDRIVKAATCNKLGGRVLFLGCSQGASNFWHWMHEVCARLVRVKKYFDLDYFDKVLIPPIGLNIWALDFMELIGLSRSQIVDSSSFFYVENMTTLNIDKVSSSFDLGDYFKSSMKPCKPCKVFLERSHASGIHKRQLLNFENYRQIYHSAGFIFVRPELLNPLEQIQLFLDAEAVVGASGSGFSLCGLMREYMQVVEIFSKHFLDPAIAMNCAVSSLRYGFFVESGFRPADENWDRNFNADIDCNELDHDAILDWIL